MMGNKRQNAKCKKGTDDPLRTVIKARTSLPTGSAHKEEDPTPPIQPYANDNKMYEPDLQLTLDTAAPNVTVMVEDSDKEEDENSGDLQQRQLFEPDVSFDVVLETIYEVMGCVEVARKLKLSYKLLTATIKSDTISLRTSMDWDGCREEIMQAQAKKKAMVPVKIIVQDGYMAALHSRGKAAKSQKAGGAKGKKVVLDLDHEDSEDDDVDDGGLMGNEAKQLEQLQAALSKCQLCGPTKSCKVARSGEHVALTHNQLCGWALSLAMGTHGVTLHTPPKSKLFLMFHGPAGGSTPAAAAPSTPVPNMGPYMNMNPFFMTPPWFMPPGFMGTPTAVPAHVPQQPTMPSSDPADDMDANPYPEISLFILRLHDHEPQRQLDLFAYEYEGNDFYYIDEIANLTVKELMQEYKISKGNAKFILEAVKKEVKKVKCARKAQK
ncbi:hypothetical protein DXG01_004392 [Tephrocybe rancida]|nr:hypothetical protein DXG01_004392 [Tephrocybe rancida]